MIPASDEDAFISPKAWKEKNKTGDNKDSRIMGHKSFCSIRTGIQPKITGILAARKESAKRCASTSKGWAAEIVILTNKKENPIMMAYRNAAR